MVTHELMTAAAPTLLVTGFGPFPSMPRNPSAAAARATAAAPRWRILGLAARARVVTTAYSALDTELDPALALAPAAVLMIGVAGRAAKIRVETRATGRRSVLFPDIAGKRPGQPSSGGEVRRTRVAPVKALRALRRHALPARLSHDAGRYLCNAAYFRALAAPVPVLFVHIPRQPRRDRRAARLIRQRQSWEERLTAALVDIGVLLLAKARNARGQVESPGRLG